MPQDQDIESPAQEPPGSPGGLKQHVIRSVLYFLRNYIGYSDNSTCQIYFRRQAIPGIPAILLNKRGWNTIS
jgi:hypothetical protein